MKEYEVLAGEGNGLVTGYDFAEAFSEGRIVIVPYTDYGIEDEFVITVTVNGRELAIDDGRELKRAEEFMTVVIDDDTSHVPIDGNFGRRRFRDLHLRPLVFETGARPEKSFLYLHCLIALLRRRRTRTHTYEADDLEKSLLTGRSWTGPSERKIRKSVLRALLVLEAGFETGFEKEALNEDNGVVDDLPGSRVMTSTRKLLWRSKAAGTPLLRLRCGKICQTT
ncbi:hypothetical protein MMC10_005779 [Thelotrema lepadinum]|nr:hypothetical protein [Thelotrema lepadinum]